ncbi:MAG: acyltransferase [Planctomycetota bacterium]|nr:acyltransferase [Planctomycetota bacterium]MDA1212860.1 acyltransferase [Planctomycetota bacterium]
MNDVQRCDSSLVPSLSLYIEEDDEQTVIHPSANIYNSIIGAGTRIAAFVEIGGSHIGRRCKIQAHAYLPPGVTLKDDVFIGPGVRFTNDRHPRTGELWTPLETYVGQGASIGAGAIILPGLTIGANAVVGAGSVVTHDVLPGETVVGNPARHHPIGISPLRIYQPDSDSDVLMILQPRKIPQAIESLERLPIDKVWFRAMTESELQPKINRFIAETNYKNYLIVSDDVCVTPEALAKVRELLRLFPAATGYCRVDSRSPQVNLTRRPVTLTNHKFPEWADYDFFHFDDVQKIADPFLSWFGGWSLTGLRRELWLEFPFYVNAVTKAQTDFETAYRLAHAGIPFITHRDTYIEHLKRNSRDMRKEHWLIGKQQPSVDWQRQESESLR